MPDLSKTFGKLTIPLLVLLAISFFAAPAHAKYGGGAGEPNDPYLIYDANQMNEIGLSVNWDDWDKHFKLIADIDLGGYTGTSFNIIGNFRGIFDGNGHTISNFTYSSTGTDYIGLFRLVDGEDAEIKDLGLIDPNVDAGTESCYVGSLVGSLYDGTITNSYVKGGSITADTLVGGLVGSNDPGGTISNCYSTGSVSGENYVGGLVGDNFYGTISNCYSTGSVSGTGKFFAGGLVGGNAGTITNCYSTASVSGDYSVGGLVGVNAGTITNCYSEGSVSGNDTIGGLVGNNFRGWVRASFWDIETGGPDNGIGTPLPTEQMQMASTFMDAGWDFVGERINGNEDIWMMTCEGMSYAKLNWWQPVPGDYFCPDGVDMIDMEHLALHWLDTGCDETNDYCDWAEISNDSTIDFTDFAILADNWLAGL